MKERDYIHPLALSVLDEVRDGEDFAELEGRGHIWVDAGQPFFTPRARAVLEAVEDVMLICDDVAECGLPCDDNACGASKELWANVRRAWRES